MSITLTISAETVEELMNHVYAFSNNPVPVLEKAVAEVKGKKEVTEAEKQKKKVSTPKKEVDSTDLISDTEPSKTDEAVERTKEEDSSEIVDENDDENEKSATKGKYPNAKKTDVQKAMKDAISAGHRDAVKIAFSRMNVEKLSDLQEADYSVFLTDLEVLVGEK
ncbi:hypothetical protein [Enterococcus timonensis]|uniref:hypothetical protein n=1 Tax=Enterococcus timonensis TaxID=1852364 RepID=UPI0008D988F2|nr:hypothetical protein [Enterococcus timonensis]